MRVLTVLTGIVRAPEWTLGDFAGAVHVSVSQLGRVFVDAYGKTPMTYLSTLRVERLAWLLHETDLPIEQAMRQVGWHSRGHAARLFRQAVGPTPTTATSADRPPHRLRRVRLGHDLFDPSASIGCSGGRLRAPECAAALTEVAKVV